MRNNSKQRICETSEGRKIHLASRNELHFEVQRTTRATVTRDKTKYTRKQKHKEKY